MAINSDALSVEDNIFLSTSAWIVFWQTMARAVVSPAKSIDADGSCSEALDVFDVLSICEAGEARLSLFFKTK